MTQKVRTLKTFSVSLLRSLSVVGSPWVIAGLSLCISIVGAVIAGPSGGVVVEGVEDASSASSRFLEVASNPFLDWFEAIAPILLPISLAFVAGMLASVNPCGFPMLPAYLAMYLGTSEYGKPQKSILLRLAKAISVSGVVTLGFISIFGLTGIAIGFGMHLIVKVFAWVGLAVGALIVLTGAWVLGGGNMYSVMAQRIASSMGDPTIISVRGYFLFGIAYATASLSCTLPIFLAVTGITLSVSNLFGAFGLFLTYGLGMGFVVAVLTLTMVIFKGVMLGAFRGVLENIQRISGTLMIVAGAYVVFYWLTTGGLLGQT